MKTLQILLIVVLLILGTVRQTEAQDFFLHENGVTILCPDAEVGDSGEVNGVTYTRRAADQITTTNAADTCTSGITDMKEMFFQESDFNEDISHWDVSSVNNMRWMFAGANPFNPSTEISYQLPVSSEVQLEVFNVMGQQVAILVSGQQNSGTHTATLDGNRLASGMYIYRLSASSFVETRQMMLVK